MKSIERTLSSEERHEEGALLGLRNTRRWKILPRVKTRDDVAFVSSEVRNFYASRDYREAMSKVSAVLRSPDKEFVRGAINGVVAGRATELLLKDTLVGESSE